MNQTLNCPACGLKIEADSKFCRGCRHPIESRPASGEAELLARSGRFVDDANDAFAACLDYLECFPEGEAAHDVKLTAALIIAYASYGGLDQALESENHSAVWNYTNYGVNLDTARLFAAGVPPILGNGLATQARLSGHRKLSAASRFVTSVRDAEARLLIPLFDEAQQEAESLLMDGKTRAETKQRTKAEVYDEAETYYRMYREGDLTEAGRGFQFLKEFNPLDAYFRSLTGALFSKQERRREAVREYLYGLHLDPGNPRLTQNLLRELTTTNLYASAVEVWRHYGVVGQHGQQLDADEEIDMLGRYAVTVLASLACATAKINPADLDPDDDDFVEKLPLPDHPWLRQPEPKAGGGGALAEKRIFISYRRADGSEAAQRIHRQLKAYEASAKVFLDQTSMQGGLEFTHQIREAIEAADLFLLLIGDYWHGAEGLRRLQQTKDLVRREVTLALRKGKTILPVLLNRADMPSAHSLPEVLRPVTRLHAERLRMAHFDADWDQIQFTMLNQMQAKNARDHAFEEKLGGSLTDEDMAAFGLAARRDFNKYLQAKSKHGEGVADPIEWFGVWECRGKGRAGQVFLRLVIEDRAESIVTGEYEVHNERGNITRHTLRGHWAMAVDLDAELTLGLYIDAVLDDGDRMYLTIPFHKKVSDVLVGLNEDLGLQFSSRNVEPRAGGF